MTKIGKLGEQIVAKWLEKQGWLILHHRWRCRWGEIDLIAQEKGSNNLAFVEVKTRKTRNWDLNGLLAITPQKQAKLWQTAEIFLSQYPHLINFSCRFDVALVSYNIDHQISEENMNLSNINIGEPISWLGYQFTLINYIESAFD